MAKTIKKRRRNLQTARHPNMRDVGEAVSYPGIDPRTWVSYGIVDADEPVDMTDADYGVLVNVVLQPSDVPCVCRVSSSCAGDGEGEYHPFMGGDEVVVLLPHGRPDADCIITGRLNNARQKWPQSVAGQDSTKNAFGFTRRRTAHLNETAGTWTVRQASTGALMTLDDDGSVMIRDGNGDALQISPDVFGYQSSDGNFILQLDVTGERCTVQAGSARMILAGANASPGNSSIAVPKLLALMAAGNVAAENACSTQMVYNIIAAAFDALATIILAVPPVPAAPGVLPALAALLKDPIFSTTALSLSAATAGTKPLNPVLASAITAAIATQSQKTQASAASPAPVVGIGSAGVLIG